MPFLEFTINSYWLPSVSHNKESRSLTPFAFHSSSKHSVKNVYSLGSRSSRGLKGFLTTACGWEGRQRRRLTRNKAAVVVGRCWVRTSNRSKLSLRTWSWPNIRWGGDIANWVLRFLGEASCSGVSVLSLYEKGDAMIIEETGKIFQKKEMKKGIAFPTSISVNNCVCHFSPLKSRPGLYSQGRWLGKNWPWVPRDGFIANVAHTPCGWCSSGDPSNRVEMQMSLRQLTLVLKLPYAWSNLEIAEHTSDRGLEQSCPLI